MLMGMAKPIPLPSARIAVLIPMTSPQCSQRAAAVARVDRRVGLQEVLVMGPEPTPLRPLALTMPRSRSVPARMDYRRRGPSCRPQIGQPLPMASRARGRTPIDLDQSQSVFGSSAPTTLPSHAWPLASHRDLIGPCGPRGYWSGCILLLVTNPEPTPRCTGARAESLPENGPKKSPNGLFSSKGFSEKPRDPKAAFFILLTT